MKRKIELNFNQMWIRYLVLTLCILNVSLMQAQDKITVTGVVTDEGGEPLPGVTVILKGSTEGVITNYDGKYNFAVNPDAILKFSFIGLESVEVAVNGQKKIDVILTSQVSELDDVTVVAFSKQSKNSVVGSITTIKPAELKVPSSNLTTALAGRVSGMISYQRSGEPGRDNAEFFVRGVTTFGYKQDPLILIDGNEVDATTLSRIHPDDIASFSVMKDATATALYGSRGANGVIIVTTKEGKEGKAKISIRAENSISQPTEMVSLADPITYMQLHNEAIKTRDPLQPAQYSQRKIEMTRRGADPYLYPAVDWQDMMFKDQAVNRRINLNISGGGKVARYYIAGSLSDDKGILKGDKQNNFDTNINLKRYMLRSNVNINVTNTTKINVRLSGSFDDYVGPLKSGGDYFGMAINSNPVLVTPYYPKTGEYEFRNHTLYGGSLEYGSANPYAEMNSGYRDYTNTHMSTQFELHQDLAFVTKGLKLRGVFSTNRYSYYEVSRSFVPHYYTAFGINPETKNYNLILLNPEEATNALGYNEGAKSVRSDVYMEAALEWNRLYADKHSFNALLVTTRSQRLSDQFEDNDGPVEKLQKSLPYRNINLAGRFAYNYNSRYFIEGNFGYNGSERFAENERFGFFPSAAVGWMMSNENWYGESLKRVLSKIKFRVSHGQSGNDAIGGPDDRFFYLSNVNLNDGGRGASFGKDGAADYAPGVSIARYANPFITWEVSTKTNLALELGLFEDLEIIAEVFKENRKSILMDRSSIPSTMGLQAGLRSNVGEASAEGFELSVNYNKYFDNNMWLSIIGNFTYANNKIEKYEEPLYEDTPYLSRVGQAIDQQWGYVAERLFIDDEDIRNSPTQFGEYMAGDIKYKDINNDGKINHLDKVPMGNPTKPGMTYGFGFSAGWKNFDLSAFFQGNGNVSLFLEPHRFAPFGGAGNALISAIADSHWSEDDRDIYAFWPRLQVGVNDNNNQVSSWWMRDVSFMRLKSLELGYNLPKKLSQKLKMENFRVYVNGTNLLTWTNFDLWDPEMGAKGLEYPVQKVFNVGVKLDF